MSDELDIVVVGSGGLGREVLWLLRSPGTQLTLADGTNRRPNVLGFLDDDPAKQGAIINGACVLGGMDWLEDKPHHAVAIAIGKPLVRRQMQHRLRELRAVFPACLSVNISIGERVTIGEGTIVLPGVVVTCNVSVGKFVLLNPNVSVSHDGAIGDYCSLGPGVSLAGNVTVHEGCDIGTQASAIPGAVIGSHTVIGAGACVLGEIPPDATAVGVPARVISVRGDDHVENL